MRTKKTKNNAPESPGEDKVLNFPSGEPQGEQQAPVEGGGNGEDGGAPATAGGEAGDGGGADGEPPSADLGSTSAQAVAVVSNKYPQKKEWPILTVALDQPELEELTKLHTAKLDEIDRVEAVKKSAMKAYTSQLSDLKDEERELRTQTRTHSKEAEVECEWFFETKGVNPESQSFVEDPGFKTLVRLDTFAVVRIAAITDGERQMALSLGDEAAAAEAPEAPAESPAEEEQDEAKEQPSEAAVVV